MSTFDGKLLKSSTTSKALEERLTQEIDDVKLTIDFLTAKAKADDAYVKSLQSINSKYLKYKYDTEDDEGNESLGRASAEAKILHSLLEYNETYTEELQDKSGEVREITGAWLANLHRDKKKILSDWKDTRKRMDSDVKEAEKREEKSLTGYTSKVKKVNSARDTVLKNCAKPQRYWKAVESEKDIIDAAQSSHNEYILEMTSLNQSYDEYYENVIPLALRQLHTMQQHHVTDFQSAAIQVAEAFDTTKNRYVDMIKKLKETIGAIKPKEEYNVFLEELKEDFEEELDIPEPVEFEVLAEAPDEHRFDEGALVLYEGTESHLEDMKAELETWIEEVQEEISGLEEEVKEKKDAQDTILNDDNAVKTVEDQEGRMEALLDKMHIHHMELEIAEKSAEKARFNKQVELITAEFDLPDNNPVPQFHDDEYYDDLIADSLKSGATMGRGTKKTPTKKKTPARRSSTAPGKSSKKNSATGRSGALPSIPGGASKKKKAKPKPKGPVELGDESWMHGKISRKEVEPLLTHRGDYLVRESAKKPGELALSVKALDHDLGRDKVTHFIIQQDVPGKYRFEGDAYPSVRELITHYREYTMAVTKRSDAKLVHAVCRDGYDGSTEEEEDDGSNPWRMTHRDIELGKKLGNGNFGEVFRGKMTSTGELVAVKTCKDTVPDPARFLEEADVLKEYDHPNIIKLIGVVETKPIYIILELCLGGDLLVYLRKNAGAPEITTYVRMAAEAADGMSYLHTKQCIHRDLAARNCLVTIDGVVKVSDFGMSRITDGDEDIYTVDTTAKTIPIKWTAPEALERMEYTLATDVWAYGILLWEIFSGGKMPYAGMTNAETKAQVINNNYRMPAPAATPEQIQQLMAECWQYEEKDRPTMADIVIWFEDIKAFYPEESA